MLAKVSEGDYIRSPILSPQITKHALLPIEVDFSKQSLVAWGHATSPNACIALMKLIQLISSIKTLKTTVKAS